MPYGRLQQHWVVPVKTEHQFYLDVREGFFKDTLSLSVDEKLKAQGTASIGKLKDYALFDVDGRTFALRWVWGMWSGNPLSIVIMHKGRILAQYGNDRAAQDDVVEHEL